MRNPNVPDLKYLLPGRIIAVSLFALFAILVLLSAAWQLLYAYISGQGLDVKPEEMWIGAMLLTVCAVSATYLLRRLLLALAFRRQLKYQIVIYNFKTKLHPIEAGLALHLTTRPIQLELLLDILVAKGIITLALEQGITYIHYQGNSYSALHNLEKAFLYSIFNEYEPSRIVSSDIRVRTAVAYVRRQAYQQLIQNNIIATSTKWQRIVIRFQKIITPFGVFITLVYLGGVISGEAFIVGYPRYSVEIWQLTFVPILMFLVVGLSLITYFSNVFTRKGFEHYSEATGMYLYIKTVFPGRFESGKISLQERNYYAPYALAFGLLELESYKKTTRL